MLNSNDNVYNTCLRILSQRGFELSVWGVGGGADHYPEHLEWTAVKDGFTFKGENPVELLGLVAIFDHLRPERDVPYWWRVEGPDFRAELLSKAFDDGREN